MLETTPEPAAHSDITWDRIQALPKAELHVHLDGSLRPGTLLEMARDRGVELPAGDPDALVDYMDASDARGLEDYLERFQVTLSVLQDEEALERAAFEVAEDAAREAVRYMEVRFSPILHVEDGLPLAAPVDAVLRGLARAREAHGIRTALIVCGIRNMDPGTSRDLADLTVAYKNRGVVAFDLAGAEYNYPAKKHRDAFFTVINKNMAATIHAGEAYGPESIHQALHYCRANRIGHGTRLHEDPDLLRYVKNFRIPLEICLTSNVQTGAVDGYESHPLRSYFDQSLVVTLNTDNRLISNTSLTREFWLAHTRLGFSWEELRTLSRMSFESAFLDLEEKQALLSRVERETDALAT